MKHKTKDEIRKIAAEQKRLIREVRREELARIEESARTEDDFEELTKKFWDKLAANHERRERYYVAELEDMTIEDVEVTDGAIVPQPLNHMWWRQMMGGNFLDVIFDCPYDLHELTSSRNISELVGALNENQKEIFYLRVIRQWSIQRIAAHRGQTDRNILKVYTTMIKNLRKKLYERLLPRYEQDLPLTLAQREFVEKHKLKDKTKTKKSPV